MKTPKSNKIKKQKLQAKKHKPVVVPPKPRVYVFTKKVRNLAQAIEEIFAKKPIDNSNKEIEHIHKLVYGDNGRDRHPDQPFLKRLLLHVANQKVDFAGKPAYNERNYQHDAKSPLTALANLARYGKMTVRNLEDWKSPSYNTMRCLASLSRHLYAKYYVPAFMDSVWFGNNTPQQEWFIHIGHGNNIRNVDGLPVSLTKREAHFFLQAPKDFSPLHAIRYGQIANMGGNEIFVRQILRTRIATDFDMERNKFYYGIFTWLMANPMLDTHHYAPIMDYIYNQKYVPYRLAEDGKMVLKQPNFSMKGREPIALLKQVEAWHRQTGKEGRGNFGEWASSGYAGLYHKVHNTIHMIREICTQKELIEEGREMRHCVASYAGSCARGNLSIWSYEIMDEQGLHKRLTIEVRKSDNVVVQARGRYNSVSSAGDMHFVKMWAKNVGLSISRYMI